MAEILDQAEEDGVEYFVKMPFWIEDTLHNLISLNGLKTIQRLAKEMELEDCKPLMSAIDKAITSKVEGYQQ